VVGLDDILIMVRKGLGEKGVGWLTKLFNNTIRSEKLST